MEEKAVIRSVNFNRDIFIRRLKELRREKGFTQPSLALRISMTKGAIGHYEAGTREPTLNTIYQFSEMFDVSVDYLMGISDFRKESDAIDYLLKKMKESGLVNADDTIDKKTVDKLVSYISVIENIKLDTIEN